MISLVIASPSPVPPSLNVTNGVKISFSCDSGMPHPLSVMTICTLWSLEKAHNFTLNDDNPEQGTHIRHKAQSFHSVPL